MGSDTQQEIQKEMGQGTGDVLQEQPPTRDCKYFANEACVSAIIKSLVDFSLELWNDRYDTLHGY